MYSGRYQIPHVAVVERNAGIVAGYMYFLLISIPITFGLPVLSLNTCEGETTLFG